MSTEVDQTQMQFRAWIPNRFLGGWWDKRCMYLKRSLSSEKPEASASTAEGVPILRRANIARYLSNNGSAILSKDAFKDSIFDSDMSSGLG